MAENDPFVAQLTYTWSQPYYSDPSCSRVLILHAERLWKHAELGRQHNPQTQDDKLSLNFKHGDAIESARCVHRRSNTPVIACFNTLYFADVYSSDVSHSI